MNYYKKKKEELRQEAKEHQRQVSELSLSWWEFCDYQEHLETLAKKYGLLKEFRENGAI